MVGNKDRLTRYIENKKAVLQQMEETAAIVRYKALVMDIEALEVLAQRILEEEEYVPELKAPKVRKPRTPKHQAKMPVMTPQPPVQQPEEIVEAVLGGPIVEVRTRPVNAAISKLQDEQE